MTEKTKTMLRTHFSATHIAYMAVFTALAFVVTFLEFPIFPPAPWFKLDFANVFFMLEGFLFGPVEAIVSITLKELLCLTKSGTMFVGEVANWIASVAYILIPSVGYRYRKGKAWVAVSLLLGSLLQIAVSLPANRFITYPLFMPETYAETFAATWYFVLAFNAVKSAAVSVIVFLLYKPFSRLIKLTRRKLERKRFAEETDAAEEKKEGSARQDGAHSGD